MSLELGFEARVVLFDLISEHRRGCDKDHLEFRILIKVSGSQLWQLFAGLFVEIVIATFCIRIEKSLLLMNCSEHCFLAEEAQYGTCRFASPRSTQYE